MGRAARAVLLLPVLVFCLWIEVEAGTGTAWNALNKAPESTSRAIFGIVYAILGPVALVVLTVWTRRRPATLTERAAAIEGRALVVAVPLALFGICLISAQSVLF